MHIYHVSKERTTDHVKPCQVIKIFDNRIRISWGLDEKTLHEIKWARN